MKLQTRDGTVYHVRFRHYLAVFPCNGFWGCRVSRRPMTEVILVNSFGAVTTKARGREIALGRALKKLVPDVPRRAELWADYYRQVEWGQR